MRRTGPGWPSRLLEGGLGRCETPPPGLLQGRPPRPARSGQHTAPTAPPPGSAWAAEPPHPRLTSPAGCLGPDAGHPDSLSSLQGSPWDRRSPTGQPPELTPPLAQSCVLPAPPTGAGHQHTSCTPTSASAAAPKTLLEEGIPDRKWPQRVTAACPAGPGSQTLAAKGDPRARLASPSAPEAQASQALYPARGSRGLVSLRRALLTEARGPGWREWNRVEGHQALNVEEGAIAPRAGQGAAREPLPVLVPPPRTLLPSCPGLSQAQGAPGRQQPGPHGEQMGVWLCRGHPRGPALLVSRAEERLRRPRGGMAQAVRPAQSDKGATCSPPPHPLRSP